MDVLRKLRSQFPFHVSHQLNFSVVSFRTFETSFSNIHARMSDLSTFLLLSDVNSYVSDTFDLAEKSK